MQKITPSQTEKTPLKNAPQKCVKFLLDYSKSYHVVDIGKSKVGLNLN